MGTSTNGSTTAEKPYQNINFRDTVTVKVGIPDVSFTVPKDVLRRHSPFFAAALDASKDWKETGENCISLPDDKEEIFVIFLEWAFCRHIVLGIPEATQTSLRANYHRLISLYVFADKVGSTSFKNEVMDTIESTRRRLSCVPASEQLHFAYRNTQRGSTLHKWVMDVLILRRNHSLYDETALLDCPELYVEVLKLGMTLLKEAKGQPPRTEKCAYHEHGDKVPKCT